jgi:hypothetical protein
VTGDAVVRTWTRIARQSQGDPVSVAHVCAAAVPGLGVDGAGVTVMASLTMQETVHATDPVATSLAELQLTLGQGPGLDAFIHGGPVLVADLRLAQYLARWPVFTPAALGIGAHTVFALPLQIGAIRLGVLNLYRARPGGLRGDELADALAFADAAGTILLTAAGGLPEAAELAWQLDDGSAHQAQVHQATGMIIAQLGIDAAAAFARLRAYAYAHDRRLGDVARDVVARRLRFDPDPPHGAVQR